VAVNEGEGREGRRSKTKQSKKLEKKNKQINFTVQTEREKKL
jgi:hypothetical protein